MKQSIGKMVIGVTGVILAVASQSAGAIEVIEVRDSGLLRSTERQILAQSRDAAETIGREAVSRLAESVLDMARVEQGGGGWAATGQGARYAELAK